MFLFYFRVRCLYEFLGDISILHPIKNNRHGRLSGSVVTFSQLHFKERYQLFKFFCLR